MPGNLLHQDALVTCLHMGQARPTVTNPRVKVSGRPVILQPTIFSITGCTLSSNAGGPCLTAQWVSAATRIRCSGLPLLLGDSQAICAPTGTGLDVKLTQTRVKGQ
jgi:hypothetical protein